MARLTPSEPVMTRIHVAPYAAVVSGITFSLHEPQASTRFDAAHARAVAAQRSKLHDLRATGEINDDVFHRLEEELDWLELAALPNNETEIVEG